MISAAKTDSVFVERKAKFYDQAVVRGKKNEKAVKENFVVGNENFLSPQDSA